jgi:FMN phosphatase YigB (HAD superfamily)
MEKKIKAVLFDLDGTLLPMDQEQFVRIYFREVVAKFGKKYGGEKIIDAVWKGTGAMVQNDGSKLNFDAFWDYFAAVYGREALEDIPQFDAFYTNEFNKSIEACSINEWPKKIVELLKQKGYDLILATNPIFPPEATMNRMQWPGLRPEDFRHITHYKNSHYCKPNPEYYREIMKTCGLEPTECMMIGNDVREDMCAGSLGMETFLVTDCLINSENADITPYRKGSIKDLYDFTAAEM